ncbi:MAG: cytochrome c-type biogenesis protein CcmH [Gammaproteobacteria bacterium]|nr:cytochrome c-type biogenesis protein CcmH [Gammaproteobacteria bacterium]MCY4322998.1 cytochrome c-type biogenesis protein CcmH [Gammaproteobacteria bacterium]
MRAWLLIVSLLSTAALGSSIDGLSFEDPALEERYRTLIENFRCPVCQNTSLAGSDAPTARDLRARVHEMLLEGHSDDEIRDWISSRYGDFVLYSPRAEGAMLILWVGPLALLLIAGLILLSVLRRARQS